MAGFKVKAIIPCAGFGTRMNMAPNESKELLVHPATKKPIIEFTLDRAREAGLDPCVITRKEKTDLIEYCEVNDIPYQVIVPEGEWMNTVLMSEPHWEDINVLILPDTRFFPYDILDNMKTDLILGANSSLALHYVTDPQNWAVVDNYTLYEKPKHLTGTCYYAFGLIAFTPEEGHVIFKTLRDKREVLLENASFQYLDSFKDITRTGVIE
jgi:dTDP-glucose pyrophosphorylase